MPGRQGEVFRAFLKLGVTSFGGPVAHLGYFRAELVDKRKWVTDQQYGELVAICQFLPGPASSQVGFGLGLIRGGMIGALAAWVAFTLPSALLLAVFALGAVSLDGSLGLGLLMGLKAVAVAVVAHAVVGMARTLTPDVRRILIGIAAAAVSLFVIGGYSQLIAIGIGTVAGLILCRRLVSGTGAHLDLRVPRWVGIAAPTVLIALLVGLPTIARFAPNVWVGIADAFTRAGAFVFGGGHVVLPLLQAEPAIASAVDPNTFLAGYGAAQAVPGPLFTFAAYLGMNMETGGAALIAAALALVSVFLPGMLLLLTALRFWNRLSGKSTIRSAMAGANAAVVGILAAALWDPVITSAITGGTPLLIAVGCFLMLTIWKVPAWTVVIVGAAAGAVTGFFGLGLTGA